MDAVMINVLLVQVNEVYVNPHILSCGNKVGQRYKGIYCIFKAICVGCGKKSQCMVES